MISKTKKESFHSEDSLLVFEIIKIIIVPKRYIIVANKSEILSTAPKSRVILVINKQNIHIIRIGGENGCRIKLFYQGCKKNCNISNKCSYGYSWEWNYNKAYIFKIKFKYCEKYGRNYN